MLDHLKGVWEFIPRTKFVKCYCISRLLIVLLVLRDFMVPKHKLLVGNLLLE
jgi:hypothetical protein